jgi:hypothetical protein
LPPSRAILFATVVASFVLVFMPVPLRTNVSPPPKPPPAATAPQTQ